MYSIVETYTRGQLIDVGNTVGAVIAEFRHKNPWIVHIGGECCGGKGLVALAMDQGLNPERYPEGAITLTDSPDVKLNGRKNGEHPVVFHNFNHVPAHVITGEGLVRSLKRFYALDPAEASAIVKAGFDWLLRNFRDKHPGARVLVAANINRADDCREKHRHTLRSDVIDINMEITGSPDRDAPGEFNRKIEIICRDESVLASILEKLRKQGAMLVAPLEPPPVRSNDWWMQPPPSRFTGLQA